MSAAPAAVVDLREGSKADRVYGSLRRRIRELALPPGAPLRKDACEQFGFLGLKLDAAKNAAPRLDENIAASDSPVQVLVIRADEDWEIACECHRLANTGQLHSP